MKQYKWFTEIVCSFNKRSAAALFVMISTAFLLSSCAIENLQPDTINLPTKVNTSGVTQITYNSATISGVISDLQNRHIIRGICWSTNINPSSSSFTKTVDSTGNGSFSISLTGLLSNTIYYANAYATDTAGTVYGLQLTFTTLKRETTPEIKLKFIQGGTFQMGSANEESITKPVHSVTLNSFYMAETEVTQEQWKLVMGSNPSYFKGDDYPVEQVNTNDVKAYINGLNALTGNTYRLPTEAEWEYAARGGNKSLGYKYAGSNTLNDVGWFDSNSNNTTHAVGSKQPNELGLYDMSGNVEEWCSDWYTGYSSSAQTNPTGSPTQMTGRVLRSGAWCYPAQFSTVSYRDDGNPLAIHYTMGLRLVSTDSVKISTKFNCGDALSIVHTFGSIAPESKSVKYGTVLSNLTGSSAKCWITQNLGASEQASSATDNADASAGWYWQFNRKQGYTTNESQITPDWTISVIDENSDWLPANDPCTIELGLGWRIPTRTEWLSADDSPQNWNSYTDTYKSVLKLHAPGTWRSSDGAWSNRGATGCYWSSTQYTSLKAWYLSFASTYSYVTPFDKAYGQSLRCVKD